MSNIDDKENLFFSTAKGVDVKAIYTEEGLLILKGSKFPYGNIKEAKKYQEGFIKKRHELLISGDLIREGDYCIFPRDFLCRPGLAVNVIFLRNRTDKWTGFKRADGTPLHTVLKKVRDVDDEEEETTISEDTEPLKLYMCGSHVECGVEELSKQEFEEFCKTAKEDGRDYLRDVAYGGRFYYNYYTPETVELYLPSDDKGRKYLNLPFLVIPVLLYWSCLLDGEDIKWNVVSKLNWKREEVELTLPTGVTIEKFSPKNLVCFPSFKRLEDGLFLGVDNYYYISPDKLKEIMHQHLDEIIECVAQLKVKSDWGKSAQTLEELKELAKQYMDPEYLFYDNGNKDEGKERVKALRQEVIDNIAKVTSERPDDGLKGKYVDYDRDVRYNDIDDDIVNIASAPSKDFVVPESLLSALEPYQAESDMLGAVDSYFGGAKVMTSWKFYEGYFEANDSNGYDYIPN